MARRTYSASVICLCKGRDWPLSTGEHGRQLLERAKTVVGVAGRSLVSVGMALHKFPLTLISLAFLFLLFPGPLTLSVEHRCRSPELPWLLQAKCGGRREQEGHYSMAYAQPRFSCKNVACCCQRCPGAVAAESPCRKGCKGRAIMGQGQRLGTSYVRLRHTLAKCPSFASAGVRCLSTLATVLSHSQKAHSSSALFCSSRPSSNRYVVVISKLRCNLSGAPDPRSSLGPHPTLSTASPSLSQDVSEIRRFARHFLWHHRHTNRKTGSSLWPTAILPSTAATSSLRRRPVRLSSSSTAILSVTPSRRQRRLLWPATAIRTTPIPTAGTISPTTGHVLSARRATARVL